MGYVTADAATITSVTATLIENAVLSFLETPKNGHIPRNFESTILLVRIPASKIEQIKVSLFIFRYLLFICRGIFANAFGRAVFTTQMLNRLFALLFRYGV